MAAKLTTKLTAGLAKVSASVECQNSFNDVTKDAETAVNLYQVGSIGLRDPHELIPGGTPEYYQKKLKKREIKESAYWGGGGGSTFSDPVTSLEGLTQIYLAWHHSTNGIINCLQSRIVKREGTSEKTVENPAHCDRGPADQRLTVTLNQGDRIEGISRPERQLAGCTGHQIH